jgi:hypothetical protein
LSTDFPTNRGGTALVELPVGQPVRELEDRGDEHHDNQDEDDRHRLKSALSELVLGWLREFDEAAERCSVVPSLVRG